jgi:4-amino-4-deoxychorismate mutase
VNAGEPRSDGRAQEPGTGAPLSATGLDPFRRRLDELDEQIARGFGERFQICREIALYKREHEIPMMQPGRVEEVRARYLARGAEVDLPEDFTGALFELMIAATCKLEDELIEAAETQEPPKPRRAAEPGRAAEPQRAAR